VPLIPKGSLLEEVERGRGKDGEAADAGLPGKRLLKTESERFINGNVNDYLNIVFEQMPFMRLLHFVLFVLSKLLR